jgi:hypothetical protein
MIRRGWQAEIRARGRDCRQPALPVGVRPFILTAVSSLTTTIDDGSCGSPGDDVAMKARPRIKSYRKTRYNRCPKCQKMLRRHTKRCPTCSTAQFKVPF